LANIGLHLADLAVRFVVHPGSFGELAAPGNPACARPRSIASRRCAIMPDGEYENWPDAGYWRGFRARLWIGLFATFAVLGLWLANMAASDRAALLSYWTQIRVPAPSFNPGPLLSAPWAVQLHVAAAGVALVVGAVILLLPKGTGFHRLLGWSWVSAMIVVAATSIMMIAVFRTGINPLHIFTAVTAISLWAGLSGIRRGNVGQHAGSMAGLYVGGLIIAGLFAFIPGRTMWNVFFGGL
jgi:uncharacterized membrane protein